MHDLQRIHHPWGHWRISDVITKVPQAVFSKVNVVNEGWVVDHDFSFLIEVIVLHEFIVEVERNPKTIWDSSFWEPEGSHRRHVGALGTKRARHFKSDIVEWENFGKAQVAWWDLRFCRAQGFIPFVNFIQCRFADEV